MNFITALDEQGYPNNYLETGTGPVNEYWLFWDAVTKEVRID
jgi:hypothetical protein